jgi:GMP synthase-like glutamine amidotransferase
MSRWCCTRRRKSNDIRPVLHRKYKMKIHYLQHVTFEGPGIILKWAESKGYSVTATRFFRGDDPPLMEDFDLLIIMGGPMGVYDEHKFPWLAEEKQFISETINKKRKVLGICLGAQLIASALGAKVYPNAQKEIGWFPVKLTEAGKSSGFFTGFQEIFSAFHWHGDTFDLPEGAHRLAESEACRNQAFAYGSNVLALQFHLEVERENIELLVKNCGSELHGAPFIQSADQMLMINYEFDQIRNNMLRILDRMER